MFTKVSIRAYYIVYMDTSTKPSRSIRTADEVRQLFQARGLSIAAWARSHGYSSQLVYQILSGRKSCLRGQSHEIAVRLGLKQGLIGALQDVDMATDATSRHADPSRRASL